LPTSEFNYKHVNSSFLLITWVFALDDIQQTCDSRANEIKMDVKIILDRMKVYNM